MIQMVCCKLIFIALFDVREEEGLYSSLNLVTGHDVILELAEKDEEDSTLIPALN
jgi:hypothetical protein